MGNETILTVDVAKDFLAGNAAVSDYSALTDEAAEILGCSSGGAASTLSLRGLKKLEVNSARELSQSKARFLELDGLVELTDELAEALSVYEGRLSLNGVQRLGDTQCEFLSRNRGGLILNSLESLTDSGAASFGRHNAPLLLGVRRLSESQAGHLAAHKASLRLKRLAELDSNEGAKALTQRIVKCPDFGTNILEFTDLRALNPEIAEILRAYKGLLYLDAIDSLDEACAIALAKHKGYALSLNGLHRGDAAVAKALSKYKGRLRLGVKTLTNDEAKAIAAYKGQCLVLGNLDTLTDEAADHFSRCPAAISFFGVKVISQTAAKRFLAHKGPLCFNLGDLPEDVQAILAKHKAVKGQAFTFN